MEMNACHKSTKDLEAHSMDILWKFVSSYYLELSIEILIILYATGGQISLKFISNSMAIL